MSELLRQILNMQNQFASGGLLLMAVGSVGVFLRSVPGRLWGWLVEQVTMTVTVTDEDPAFTWMKEWFLEQRCLRRIRQLDLNTRLRGTGVGLIPAPGVHWFLRGRRPFRVRIFRSEENRLIGRSRSESLCFETIGRDQAVLRRFVAEVVACHQRKIVRSSHLYLYDEGWEMLVSYCPRLLESVLLKPGEKEHLVQDLERFRAARDRYRRLGVPYHRGYLLYGPPGTGKTSLVSAVAAHLGMSIYVIDLGELTDHALRSAVNSVPGGSVVLFEDIDCVAPGSRNLDGAGGAREGSVRTGTSLEGAGQRSPRVSLSGLLNVLDGFHAPEDVVYVMTSNDVAALDPALLRPGRIDYRLYMGDAAESQKLELYRRFFPDAREAEAREFVRAHAAETMAAFQGLLLAREQASADLELDEVSR